jgi:hypothetical protein
MRVFLAGLLGGIAMFIWTQLTYTVLPLGYIGIRGIPNEGAVLGALQKDIAEKSGVYIFPGPIPGPNQTDEQKAVATNDRAEKVARYPSGILIYNAAGTRPIAMFRSLSVEFVTELAEAILAVFLLSRTCLATFGARVGFVLITGILVAIGTNVSDWIWYGFSGSYILAYMFIQVVGFLCVGLVAALVLKNQTLPAKVWFSPGISRIIFGRLSICAASYGRVLWSQRRDESYE